MAFMCVEVPVQGADGRKVVLGQEREAGARRLVLVGDDVATGRAAGMDATLLERVVFLNGTWPEIHDEVPI